MSMRSLFSINANPSGGGQGIAGFGNLMRGHLIPNPNYDPNDPNSQPFISKGGIFGSGGRLADEANSEVFGKKILAKYGSNLAQQRDVGFLKAKADQAHSEEERTLGEQGSAIGQVMGDMPTDQASKIFPQSQTFASPQEQAKAYNVKFGGNTPVAQAPGSMLKAFGSGGHINPMTGEFMEPGKYVPEQNSTIERVATGKSTPEMQPDGSIKMVPEYREVPRTITTEKYNPPNSGVIRPAATQDDLNAIPKSAPQEQQPKINQSYVTQPEMGGAGYMSTNFNPALNLNLSQQPTSPVVGTPITVQAKPVYRGSEFSGTQPEPYVGPKAPMTPATTQAPVIQPQQQFSRGQGIYAPKPGNTNDPSILHLLMRLNEALKPKYLKKGAVQAKP